MLVLMIYPSSQVVICYYVEKTFIMVALDGFTYLWYLDVRGTNIEIYV